MTRHGLVTVCPQDEVKRALSPPETLRPTSAGAAAKVREFLRENDTEREHLFIAKIQRGGSQKCDAFPVPSLAIPREIFPTRALSKFVMSTPQCVISILVWASVLSILVTWLVKWDDA